MEVLVEFEYDAKEEDELTMNVGDIITNVTRASDGWYEGTLNGKRGMFPDNFVKEIKKEKPTPPVLPAAKKPAAPTAPDPAKQTSNAGGVSELRNRLGSTIISATPGQAAPVVAGKKPNKKAKVHHDYKPENPDELALEVGQIVEILKQEEEGWWEGSINGKSGLFPSNFVDIIDSSAEQTPAEEVTEIRGRRIQGVGFGNIFGGGPINLRPTGPVPPKKEVTTPDGDREVKVMHELPRASVKAKVQTPSTPSHPTPAPPVVETKPQVRAIVRYPYTAANEDELSLAEGDTVVVLDQNLADAGWWRGELRGQVGVFPDNFVELLPSPETKPQRPPVPIVPPNNGVVQQASVDIEPAKPKKEGPREPPARPPSMLLTDKASIPKVATKVPESRPNIETDDHKAKNQEVYRSGTLDRAVTSDNPLKPLTADRAKVPGRRPPNMAARRDPVAADADIKKEEKVQPAAVNRIQPIKEEPSSLGKKDPVVSPVRDGPVAHKIVNESSAAITQADLVHMQQEIARLRDELEQTKRHHDKRLANLTAELDEEKKTRLNLQVEIDRLKKRLTD